MKATLGDPRTDKPLMKCGHAAQGINGDGDPVCVICWPDPNSMIVDDSPPDLSDRVAKCAYCKREAPSNTNLPFFEFQGKGSRRAKYYCKNCGGHRTSHEARTKDGYSRGKSCDNFEPCDELEYDEYYCGCRGWN